jgi:hypothetical protein
LSDRIAELVVSNRFASLEQYSRNLLRFPKVSNTGDEDFSKVTRLPVFVRSFATRIKANNEWVGINGSPVTQATKLTTITQVNEIELLLIDRQSGMSCLSQFFARIKSLSSQLPIPISDDRRTLPDLTTTPMMFMMSRQSIGLNF